MCMGRVVVSEIGYMCPKLGLYVTELKNLEIDNVYGPNFGHMYPISDTITLLIRKFLTSYHIQWDI